MSINVSREGIFDVLIFNRKQKSRIPIQVEDLFNLHSSSSSPPSPLSPIFFKKNAKTEEQKRLRCNPCNSILESHESFLQHVKGVKHLGLCDKGSSFPDKSPENHFTQISLADVVKDEYIIGLKYILEIRSSSLIPKPAFYKCKLHLCKGFTETANGFWVHLKSKTHILHANIADHVFETMVLMSMSKEELWNAGLKSQIQSSNVPLQTVVDDEKYSLFEKRKFKFYKMMDDKKDYIKNAKDSFKDGDCDEKKKIKVEGNHDEELNETLGNTNLKRKSSEEFDGNKNDVKKAKLETKALKAKRPGFTDERYNETSYYIDTENNLRKVTPYYFTFTTFTKGRWVGEKILDVFSREFRAHPSEEYERCIKAGTLTVNYEKVSIDYKLKHNDLLANIVHRHEVPVTANQIEIIHVDDDIVVVNKPASIPVHPCGRYRHNTVVFILAKDHGFKNLRTVHRLDRLTSGLLLFGRHPKKAREMEQQIRTRLCQKEYVCRVVGEFPRERTIVCTEPIEVLSYKIGVCKVSSSGKDCHTEFTGLSYNGVSSVVLCRPHTGRMHQIRVHLQYLGYPILNDSLYNHCVFGAERGKGGNIGKSDEELIQSLISFHNAENWLGLEEDELGVSCEEIPSLSDKKIDPQTSDSCSESPNEFSSKESNEFSSKESNESSSKESNESSSKNSEDSDKVHMATQTGGGGETEDVFPSVVDPHCIECKVKYRDPKPQDLIMYLHALKYSGPDWSYSTELPKWAQPDWIEK